MRSLEEAKANAGKYLTFVIGAEEFGLEILKVREIIGYVPITAVPQTPDHVKGVVNLRGQVIPVVDLRSRFGMDATETTSQTCIIVVETIRDGAKCSAAVIVDHVCDVLDIQEQTIEDPPHLGPDVWAEGILGMAKIGNSVKILLDIDQVLERTHVAACSTCSDTAP